MARTKPKKKIKTKHLSDEQTAENRRKLIKTLDPDTAAMVIKDFARLGLHQ